MVCLKPNITKEEVKALKEFRQDKDRVIHRVNKAMTMVPPDRQDYINKDKELLAQRGVYRALTADPTKNTKRNSCTCLVLLRLNED